MVTAVKKTKSEPFQWCPVTRDNGNKPKHMKFHLNITKHLFMVWVTKSHPRFMRNVVESPCKNT